MKLTSRLFLRISCCEAKTVSMYSPFTFMDPNLNVKVFFFNVFHSVFDTCVFLPCAVTELVLNLELVIIWIQAKRSKISKFRRSKVRLKVHVIVIGVQRKSSGMIQTEPGHDRRSATLIFCPKCVQSSGRCKNHISPKYVWSSGAFANHIPPPPTQIFLLQSFVSWSLHGECKSHLDVSRSRTVWYRVLQMRWGQFYSIANLLQFFWFKIWSKFLAPFCVLMDLDCKSHPPWVGHGQCGRAGLGGG